MNHRRYSRHQKIWTNEQPATFREYRIQRFHSIFSLDSSAFTSARCDKFPNSFWEVVVSSLEENVGGVINQIYRPTQSRIYSSLIKSDTFTVRGGGVNRYKANYEIRKTQNLFINWSFTSRALALLGAFFLILQLLLPFFYKILDRTYSADEWWHHSTSAFFPFFSAFSNSFSSALLSSPVLFLFQPCSVFFC